MAFTGTGTGSGAAKPKPKPRPRPSKTFDQVRAEVGIKPYPKPRKRPKVWSSLTETGIKDPTVGFQPGSAASFSAQASYPRKPRIRNMSVTSQKRQPPYKPFKPNAPYRSPSSARAMANDIGKQMMGDIVRKRAQKTKK